MRRFLRHYWSDLALLAAVIGLAAVLIYYRQA